MAGGEWLVDAQGDMAMQGVLWRGNEAEAKSGEEKGKTGGDVVRDLVVLVLVIYANLVGILFGLWIGWRLWRMGKT